MASILPFKLKVPGSDEFKSFAAVSTSYRFHGFLRLDHESLTIEWGGVAQRQEVGIDVRDEKIALPDEQLVVPLSALYRARLAGGWWRPRLEVQARQVNALAFVPSEDHGTVAFWYARSDGRLAHAFATELSHAINRTLELGEGTVPALPPE
jgi:hypothetical protein